MQKLVTMMIEKLAVQHMLYMDALPLIENKINELIDTYNEFVFKFNHHYHETLDTHYNTSSPYVYAQK